MLQADSGTYIHVMNKDSFTAEPESAAFLASCGDGVALPAFSTAR